MSHLVCAPPLRKWRTPRWRRWLSSCAPPVVPGILAQFAKHDPGEREARGEAGRLDAIELHEPWHAVLRRPLDLEIRRRLAGSRGLRADAGIARRERTIRQSGPITPDGRIEPLGTSRIDIVVNALDPFDVWPEARLSREIERNVHAEPARLGHRVDQPLEWVLPVQGVVIPLRIELARYEVRGMAVDGSGNAGGAQAGAIDEHPAVDRLAAGDVQLEPIAHPCALEPA